MSACSLSLLQSGQREQTCSSWKPWKAHVPFFVVENLNPVPEANIVSWCRLSSLSQPSPGYCCVVCFFFDYIPLAAKPFLYSSNSLSKKSFWFKVELRQSITMEPEHKGVRSIVVKTWEPQNPVSSFILGENPEKYSPKTGCGRQNHFF